MKDLFYYYFIVSWKGNQLPHEVAGGILAFDETIILSLLFIAVGKLLNLF
jgi:hypothetical protein